MNTPFPVWNVHSAVRQVVLFKCDDHQYIVTQDGAWASLLCNGLYVIVSQAVLDLIRQHCDPIPESHPVSIYDRVLDTHFPGYHRIYPEVVDPIESILTVDARGSKIWVYGGGIPFVSAGFKEVLAKAKIEDLVFRAGLSGIG